MCQVIITDCYILIKKYLNEINNFKNLIFLKKNLIIFNEW